MHLGGVHRLWSQIEAEAATEGLKEDKALLEARAQFNETCTQIGQLKNPPVSLKPLKEMAVFQLGGVLLDLKQLAL